jgi:hypothetical protein
MREILLIVTAVLLVLVLSVAVAGCRKSSGKKGGGGYLPAPTRAPCQLPPSPDREKHQPALMRPGEGPDRPSGTLCGTSPQVR